MNSWERRWRALSTCCCAVERRAGGMYLPSDNNSPESLLEDSGIGGGQPNADRILSFIAVMGLGDVRMSA